MHFVTVFRQYSAQGNIKKAIYKESGYSLTGHQVQSNVRLNEINPQAFRHFRKNYPICRTGILGKNPTMVSLHILKMLINMSLAYYDNQGAFLYSVKYFEESDAE